MVTPQKGTITIHADQEHSGIRIVIFFMLFVGLFIGFLLISWFIRTIGPPGLRDYALFLSCTGSIPLALLSIWVLEKFLKRVWHSGLSLTLDETGLIVNDTREKPDPRETNTTPPKFVWGQSMTVLTWYFKLSGYQRGGRERRVPAKWYCLAAELIQDDSRLSVFTFMPPNNAKLLIDKTNSRFEPINQAEIYSDSFRNRIGPPSRPTIPNELLHSKQGPYWVAERRRWQSGIELTAEDFITLLKGTQSATNS